MPTFMHDGVQIYYEKMGVWDNNVKCPVLFLHGNGESMETFSNITTSLGKTFPIIAIDSRGQGKSTVSGETPVITYELMAQDAYELLEQLQIEQCDIVGFSDGAILALMLAMGKTTRGKVRRIVSIGANLSPYGLKPLALAQMKFERRRSHARGDMKNERLIDMMLTSPNISSRELADIYAQCAIVAGASDIVKQKHTELIAGAIMHSRLIIVEGAGHMIPQTHPDKLSAIIFEELK